MPVRSSKSGLIAAVVVLWIATISAGAGLLIRYSNSPGELAAPPAEWPRSSALARTPGRAALLLFAHPQCPCSAASLDELSRILAHAGGQIDTYVLFYAPEKEPAEWVRGALWKSAAELPGVRAVEDARGREIRLFRAATSGQALLYDERGHLLFNGGITARRGHSGANDGGEAVLALARGGAARETAPVFGCSLLGASE